MVDTSTIKQYWESYRASLPTAETLPESPPGAWYFGSTEEMANELGELARNGIKTATTSLLWEYEAEGEALPEVGQKSIIIDWHGHPLCIIETTEVTVKAFNEVDEAFAYDEGEGDRSLEYWRQAHWHFFSKWCTAMKREPGETMPVVNERFRVIFPIMVHAASPY